jgi:hypothetical protein
MTHQPVVNSDTCLQVAYCEVGYQDDKVLIIFRGVDDSAHPFKLDSADGFALAERILECVKKIRPNLP